MRIPFQTPELRYLPRIYRRIDGIQPGNTSDSTVFYVDDVDLEVLR